MTPRARKSACKQTNYSASIFLGLRTKHILKPINLTTYYHKIISFIRSFVQSAAPRIRTEMIEFTCRFACSRAIHACEWPSRNPIHPSSVTNLKEYLIPVYLVTLTEHTESKMIILRVDRCKVQDYFCKFCIRLIRRRR